MELTILYVLLALGGHQCPTDEAPALIPIPCVGSLLVAAPILVQETYLQLRQVLLLQTQSISSGQ
jgi:hypothetical protein